MCGPIVVALPLPASARWQMTLQMLIYHAGRILTYAALGLFFGLMGKGIELAGFQKVISMAAGVLMLTAAFWTFRGERAWSGGRLLQGLTAPVKQRMSRLLRAHSTVSTFTLGLLNGLLPCGMVYLAVAGAITSISGWQGSAYMAFFGLGTLPLLLAVSLSGRLLKVNLRRRLRWVQPTLLALAGALLLLRGLQLDLTAFDVAVPKAAMDCH